MARPSRDGVDSRGGHSQAVAEIDQTRWQVEIGEGYSSPVVANGRAFLHSRRDPEEIVTAIDLATGKVVWQQKYTAAFTKNQYATQMAKGPNSTPLVAGNRLFTLGVTGILTAWNVADGTIAWRQDYSASIDTSKLFCGTAMSPMLEGGALIVQVGSDVHGGRVLALDPATGKERWSWTGPGPRLRVAGGRDHRRRAPDHHDDQRIDRRHRRRRPAPRCGRSRSRRLAREHRHADLDRLVADRVRHASGDARLFDRQRGPPTRPEAAPARSRRSSQEPERAKADRWQTKQLWKNAEVTMYTASPVFIDGVIYGMSNKRRGQFVALRATDGWLKWSTPGRDGNHASILQANEHVLFLTDGGVLIVARRTAEGFTEERRYEIGLSTTWAQPILLADGMLVREATGVVKLLWE